MQKENQPSPTPPPPSKKTKPKTDVTRRSFIQTLGISAAAGAINQQLNANEAELTSNGTNTLTKIAPKILSPEPNPTTLNINNQNVQLTIDPATTLLEALRHHLNLTGTKEICDRGACGGCSVHLDGKLINSCMLLAHDAVGKKITTIEGLATAASLDPVQTSFIRHDALQCGYCTPGFVMASKALLNENPQPSVAEIRKGLAGNFCRCGCHCNAVNAVLDASGQEPLIDGGDQA